MPRPKLEGAHGSIPASGCSSHREDDCIGDSVPEQLADWYALIAGPGSAYFPSVLTLAVAGIGLSMALPVTPTAALGAVAMQDIGKASGVNSTLQRFGSAFGVAVVTSVSASYGSLASSASLTAGYRPAMAACALMALVGALAALGVGNGCRASDLKLLVQR